MIVKNVDKADGKSRIDKYILRLLPGLKPGLMHKQFRNKNILLNGHKISGNEIVKEGDELKFFFSDETYLMFSKGISDNSENAPMADKYAEIAKQTVKMYESDPAGVKIIMNKPSDMLSQRSDSGELSLNEWLIGYLIKSGYIKAEDMIHFKPSVLNRLDRNTSGIVLGSKSMLGATVISKALKDRTLNKYYRTIVSGKYEKKPGIYTAYLSKEKSTNKVNILTDLVDGKIPVKSADKYSVIKTGIFPVTCVSIPELGDVTMLEIDLITGKSHQIRAHLSALGYPIAGDPKYGDKDFNKRFSAICRVSSDIGAKDGYISQFLHSYKIVFDGSIVKELDLDKDTFVCPVPDLWDKLFSEF